jgi:hypothetical protein
MAIIEFNPILALRNYDEHQTGHKRMEECIPEVLEVGKIYPFLKKDQRSYWLQGEVPLQETTGNGGLTRPMASVLILEATHFMDNNQVYTRGLYKVIEVFNDQDIHFDALSKVNTTQSWTSKIKSIIS